MRLDVLIRDARVLTMDPLRPRASTVGLWQGRIVGLDGELAGMDAASTVDAQGAVLIPGLHDAHTHTTSFGLGLTSLDLSQVVGVAAVLDSVRAWCSRLGPSDWVIGSGYGLGMAPGEQPSLSELDRVADGRPVWLTHFSGHSCVLNAVALRLVGITAATVPSDGRGSVRVDADGEPTGSLDESAMDLVKKYHGPSSIERLAACIGVATAVYAADGVTTFVDAGIGSPGIDHSPAEVAAYQLARQSGRLAARGQLMVHDAVLHPVGAHPDDAIGLGLDLGLRTGFGDAWLELGAMKIWVDGSSADAGFDDDPAVLRRSIIDGARAGWQVAAHAMGDAAVELTLDALEEAAAGPAPGYAGRTARHRIEHGGLIRPDQIERMARLGVVVAHQPAFLTTFGDALLASVGEHRAPDCFRARSLLEAGVVVAGSSDRPVAPGAPLVGVQAMTQRVTESGRYFGFQERVDAATALAAYTRGGAFAAGREKTSGMLRRGFDADLVLLGDDPTAVAVDAISAIEVMLTVVDGATTHDPHKMWDAVLAR